MYNYDRRKKTAGIADTSPMDVDEALDAVKDLVRELKKYHRSCAVLPPVYKKLGDALETKAILEQASKVEQLCKSIADFGGFLNQNTSVIKKMGKEFDHMVDKMAKDLWSGRGLVESVQKLPAAGALFRLGQEFDKRVEAISDDGIDWLLEDYIGSSAKIYSRLERVQPGAVEDLFYVDNPFYAVLSYYSDKDLIEDMVENARD